MKQVIAILIMVFAIQFAYGQETVTPRRAYAMTEEVIIKEHTECLQRLEEGKKRLDSLSNCTAKTQKKVSDKEMLEESIKDMKTLSDCLIKEATKAALAEHRNLGNTK